jgi:hypothetical protein
MRTVAPAVLGSFLSEVMSRSRDFYESGIRYRLFGERLFGGVGAG